MHTSTISEPDSGDTIPTEHQTTTQRRRTRRRAFWAGVSDILLSIPPGIALRMGG